MHGQVRGQGVAAAADAEGDGCAAVSVGGGCGVGEREGCADSRERGEQIAASAASRRRRAEGMAEPRSTWDLIYAAPGIKLTGSAGAAHGAVAERGERPGAWPASARQQPGRGDECAEQSARTGGGDRAGRHDSFTEPDAVALAALFWIDVEPVASTIPTAL